MCPRSLSLPALYVTVVGVREWKGKHGEGATSSLPSQVNAPNQVCFPATGGVTWSMFQYRCSARKLAPGEFSMARYEETRRKGWKSSLSGSDKKTIRAYRKLNLYIFKGCPLAVGVILWQQRRKSLDGVQRGRFGQRIFTQETAVRVPCETKSQLCYLNVVIQSN